MSFKSVPSAKLAFRLQISKHSYSWYSSLLASWFTANTWLVVPNASNPVPPLTTDKGLDKEVMVPPVILTLSASWVDKVPNVFHSGFVPAELTDKTWWAVPIPKRSSWTSPRIIKSPCVVVGVT